MTGKQFFLLGPDGSLTTSWFELYANSSYQGHDGCGAYSGGIRWPFDSEGSVFLSLAGSEAEQSCRPAPGGEGTLASAASQRPRGPLRIERFEPDGSIAVVVVIPDGVELRARHEPGQPQPEVTSPADVPMPLYVPPRLLPPPSGSLRELLAGRLFGLVAMDGVGGWQPSWFAVHIDDSVTMQTDCGNRAEATITYHADGSVTAGARLDLQMQTAMGCLSWRIFPPPRGELTVRGVTEDGRVYVSLAVSAGVRIDALSET